MTVTDRTDRAEAPWAMGYRTPDREYPEWVDVDVEGDVPDDVRGVLYRVGPAGHDVFGDRYRHPFDGDGMLHALEIDRGRIRFASRWIDTIGRRAEQAAGRRLYGSFATPPAGGRLERFRNRQPKNTANINVVAHRGSLLALWEGGHPYRIDQRTLETIGEDDLGVLGPRQTFSAHPKHDPVTDEMWNFGIEYGPTTRLRLYRVGDRAEVVSTVTLPRAFMVHDFALTPTRAVFVCPPIALPRVPLALLTGQRAYAECLRWDPSFGTRVLVIDRASGEHRWHELEPLFVFHTAGAFDDGDDVAIDVCAYDDDSVMRALPSLMTGSAVPDGAPPFLTRLTVGRSSSRHRLTDVPFEFPRRSGRAITGLTTTPDGQLGQPVALDTEDWLLARTPTAPGVYAGEPIPIKAGSGRRWFATVVLDAPRRCSELWLVDAGAPEEGPALRATLPAVVPFALHGSWVGAA